MLRIAILSKYSSLGSSSRLRMLQYIPYLREQGFVTEHFPLLSDSYVQALYRGQSTRSDILSGYWNRLKSILALKDFDVLWIEKELFPFLPFVFETLLLPSKKAIVVDIDDATFHVYDKHKNPLVRALLGRKIDGVFRRATAIVAGCPYLAERAAQSNANVHYIPTVVDETKYPRPLLEAADSGKKMLTIGWIGSPSTEKYVLGLAEVIAYAIRHFPVRFQFVGARPSSFKNLPVEVITWTEDTEAALLANFDIGIMPLEDSAFERGKCGFKLVQYMAAGKAVIASPVGVNTEIVKEGVNGFLADSSEAWIERIKQLSEQPELRQHLGSQGRILFEEKFSLGVNAPKLATIFQSTWKAKSLGRLTHLTE